MNQRIKNGEEINTSLIPMEGQTLEQIRTPYVTAVRVQKPRDLIEVERKCLIEAALAGESCYYGWSAGKDRIEGPSIELAMILGRNWGNCAVEAPPVVETKEAFYIPAAFIDIENGTTITRFFRQSRTSIVYGKMDEERKADVRFQIGQSKAQRNVIVRALPSWLVDKCLDRAKQGVREKLEKFISAKGIAGARSLVLKEFAKHGVTEERIVAKYQKKVAEWDVEVLTTLRGDLHALNQKVEEPYDLFPEVSAHAVPPDLDPANFTEVDNDQRPQEEKNVEQAGLVSEIEEFFSVNKDKLSTRMLKRLNEVNLKVLAIEALKSFKAELEEDVETSNAVKVAARKTAKKPIKEETDVTN